MSTSKLHSLCSPSQAACSHSCYQRWDLFPLCSPFIIPFHGCCYSTVGFYLLFIGCAVFVVSSRLCAVSWLSNSFRPCRFLPCCFRLDNFYSSVAIAVNALDWRCHSGGDTEGKRGSSKLLNPEKCTIKFVFRVQNIFDLLVSFEELKTSPVLLLLLQYTYQVVNVRNLIPTFLPSLFLRIRISYLGYTISITSRYWNIGECF